MKPLSALLVLLLTSCASIPNYEVCDFEEGFGKDLVTGIAKRIPFECIENPEIIELPTYLQLRNLPPAEIMPVVAVYGFKDLTGQRKSKDNLASFSTAVTQGGTEMLIDALNEQAQKIKELKNTNKSLINDVTHISSMYDQLWKKLERLIKGQNPNPTL